MQLQKEQQIETTKKSIKICKKTLSKPSNLFLHLNFFSIEPFPDVNNNVCDLSLFRIGSNKKRQRNKLCNTFLCFKIIIFKVKKAIGYKMALINMFVFSSKGSA